MKRTLNIQQIAAFEFLNASAEREGVFCQTSDFGVRLLFFGYRNVFRRDMRRSCKVVLYQLYTLIRIFSVSSIS